jgi:lipoate---protein ligase
VRLLDLTLPTPAENLALDEALLDEAEDSRSPSELLRLWEPSAPMVVVGRSSQVEIEVRQSCCRELGIPVLRRSSGGAAIVTGPGCLMYAVVLNLEMRPQLRPIDAAHRFTLHQITRALRRPGLSVELCGTSDLALGDRKFSGNSLRVRREHLLYHGTLLYDFPLDLIAACLDRPPRQPDYRAGRGHADFVTNLPLAREELHRAFINAWQLDGIVDRWPQRRVDELVTTKYSRDDWNFRR